MERPLPRYTHIPGVTPHPIRDPAGHSYAEPKTLAEILNEAPGSEVLTLHDLSAQPEFPWAVTLFNAGYYWEAHEVWETLWHRAGRSGLTADYLKGLIKLAAAGVKLREHNSAGIERHAQRACELFRAVENGFQPGRDLEMVSALPRLIALAERIRYQPPPFPEDRAGKPVSALPRLPQVIMSSIRP